MPRVMSHIYRSQRASALLVGSPLIPVATAQSMDVRTVSATSGNTYGGVTSQGWPVVIDLTATRRQLVRAVIALDMTCTSGDTGVSGDRYTKLAVTKSGRFGITYGPVTKRNDAGTTTDYQGRLAGRLYAAKTRISGTWVWKFTNHDATGGVTDTCDSGSVTWTAKQ